MAKDEKSSTVHQQQMGEIEVVQTVHTDGTVDYVDAHAVGGDVAQMPEGYYGNIQFVGTVIVSYQPYSQQLKKGMIAYTRQAVCCASICAYLGWVLPANTLYVYPILNEL
jgi:hypothetical protein